MGWNKLERVGTVLGAEGPRVEPGKARFTGSKKPP